MNNSIIIFQKALLLILGLIFLNGCIEPASQDPINIYKVQKEELAEKAHQYFENWKTYSKKNFRTASEFNTFYPQWQLLSLIDSSLLVIVPATRRLDTRYGDKAYLRRMVFKFDKTGEVETAGIIELIGLDLEYLKKNEHSLIKGYFDGYQNNEKAIYIWSDLDFKNNSTLQNNGYSVYITSENINNVKNLRLQNCVDWYYVYTLDGVVIGEEYLFTTCEGSGCDENTTDACLEELPEGGGGGIGTEDDSKICGTYSFTNIGNSLTTEIHNLGMTAIKMSLFQGEVIPVELGPICFNFSANLASSVSASTIINEAFNSTTLEIQQGLNNGTINAANIYIQFKNKFDQKFNTLKNSFGLPGNSAGFSYGPCFGQVTINTANYLCL